MQWMMLSRRTFTFVLITLARAKLCFSLRSIVSVVPFYFLLLLVSKMFKIQLHMYGVELKKKRKISLKPIETNFGKFSTHLSSTFRIFHIWSSSLDCSGIFAASIRPSWLPSLLILSASGSILFFSSSEKCWYENRA